MDIWVEAVEIFGNVVVAAGVIILAYNLITLFTSLNSQNAEGKNHAGLGIAAAVGVIIVGTVLIPMLATSITI